MGGSRCEEAVNLEVEKTTYVAKAGEDWRRQAKTGGSTLSGEHISRGQLDPEAEGLSSVVYCLLGKHNIAYNWLEKKKQERRNK